MSTRRLSAAAVSIAAALVAGAVLVPGTGSAQTSTTDQDTVTVTAVGKVEGRPDLAVINFGIRGIADTAQGAMEVLARRQNAVIDALENDVGLPDDQVRTGNISLRRNCRFDRNRERTVCSGYVARTSVRAETRDLDQVGAIIDAGVSAGASSLSGVSFERTENDQALRDALAQAMELARGKAEALATSAGRNLGRVMVIEEGGARRPAFSADTFARAGGGTAFDLVVDPPDDITRVVIVVTFALN